MEHIAVVGKGKQDALPFRSLEFQYLIDFAVHGEGLSEGTCQDQLQALWTAYCMHHSLDADTNGYDNDLLTLWNRMQEAGIGADVWESYDTFDIYMSEYLC